MQTKINKVLHHRYKEINRAKIHIVQDNHAAVMEVQVYTRGEECPVLDLFYTFCNMTTFSPAKNDSCRSDLIPIIQHLVIK